jgi:hypothetical protein
MGRDGNGYWEREVQMARLMLNGTRLRFGPDYLCQEGPRHGHKIWVKDLLRRTLYRLYQILVFGSL